MFGKKQEVDINFEAMVDYLVRKDIGIEVSEEIAKAVQGQSKKINIKDNNFIYNVFNDKILGKSRIKKITEKESQDTYGQNQVIFVVGINGSGKTSSVAKMANYYKNKGLSVGIVAADTFRAGAVAQISQLGAKISVPVLEPSSNHNPSTAIYKGIEHYTKSNMDIIIIDTSGRAHSSAPLMQELEKSYNVAKKLSYNMRTRMVLNGTNGGSAISQLEAFLQYITIDDLVITRLDSRSAGGFSIPIILKNKSISLKYACYGENITDIRPIKTLDLFKEILKFDGQYDIICN